MQDWHFPAADIEQLGRDKVMIGRAHYRQIFEAYTNTGTPLFITSDALLSAFHALFEDTFRELEVRRQPALKDRLEAILADAKLMLEKNAYRPAELAPGWARAQRVIGPAMVLLGTPACVFDEPVRRDIEFEVAAIRKAGGIRPPVWAGPSTSSPPIDYRRLRPVGMYDSSEHLRNYFRAVRWLQLAPMQVKDDDSLTALMLLGHAVRQQAGGAEFLTAYADLIGRPDRESVLQAASFPPPDPSRAVGSWSDCLQRERAARQALEQRMQRESHRTFTLPTVYHFLPTYLLPDGELFDALGALGEPIDGLVVGAMVGSEFAEARLKPRDPSQMAAALNRAKPAVRLHSPYSPVYDQYMALLQTLFAPPDPDAPTFVRQPAWSAKSCQTALAGWAQMRHSYVLQAKLSIVYLAAGLERPAGFIEPNPTFLRTYSEFIASVRSKLAAAGAFTATAEAGRVRRETFAEMSEALAAKVQGGGNLKQLPETDQLWSYLANDWRTDSEGDESACRVVRDLCTRLASDPAAPAAPVLRELAALLRQPAKKEASAVRRFASPQTSDRGTEERWARLERTALRLEAMLQKQLGGRPWTRDEAGFIRNFGAVLKECMGYSLDWHQLRDDAPRCVEVLYDERENRSLHAAVGRPQPLYVLYPWGGRDVFCQGAVIPYFEFRSTDRLTDQEWKQQLDSATAPAAPNWIQPILQPDGSN